MYICNTAKKQQHVNTMFFASIPQLKCWESQKLHVKCEGSVCNHFILYILPCTQVQGKMLFQQLHSHLGISLKEFYAMEITMGISTKYLCHGDYYGDLNNFYVMEITARISIKYFLCHGDYYGDLNKRIIVMEITIGISIKYFSHRDYGGDLNLKTIDVMKITMGTSIK